MRFGLFRFGKNRSATVDELETIRSLFAKFRRIQKLNTRALELMAAMEQALGGEYIFDRAFLDSSVRDLSTLTHQVVYSLNAMSQNRYVELFDCYQSIRGVLDDILEGGAGPFAAHLTLAYPILGWELEPLVGTLNVCLAEARQRLDLPAPDGFAVSVAGCRLFMEENAAAGMAAAGAFLPAALTTAIQEELHDLCARRKGVAALTVRICNLSGSEGPPAEYGEQNKVRPEDLLSVCREVLSEHAARAAAGADGQSGGVALAVHEAVAAEVFGDIVGSYSAELSSSCLRVTAAPVGEPDKIERYLLRRVYPFDPVRSEICPKDAETPLPAGMSPLSLTPGGLYRGSALVEPSFLQTVAEYLTAFERLLGYAPELHWVRTEKERRPVIVDVKPAAAAAGNSGERPPPAEALAAAEILLQGGDTVQTGVAAGRSVHIGEDYDVDSFPYGAVAVARVASPKLTPILRRASAIITEIGSSIGHLATIARELRVPGLFGMPEALQRVPPDIDVTVDASERTIYRGIVEPLLASRTDSAELYPGDPEYAALRRLLRWIMPLNLIDPEAPEFSVQNCRTYHDIIHFAHERSVEELLKMQERGRRLVDLHARKIEVDYPLDLFVIDIGGGIAATAGARVRPNEIVSAPFKAFLQGLATEEMWQTGPGSIRMKDIFSGLDRTFAAMTQTPQYAGRNHAIVAQNYMNLGLRLGYHFSVIDSYLGEIVNQNYIYFRFVGGFADERRRRRRAELIRAILEDMRFKVVVKGDLVVGNFKIAEQEEMQTALTRLGELTGFTRQLDISMIANEQVAEFRSLFRHKTSNGGTAAGREESDDG